MLSTIRDRATGWIAGVIVGLLIISFAFWGVSFYSGQSSGINVALVNDTEISFQSFQRSFAQLRKQMQSILGDSLSLEEEALIKNQTLEKLIESELINQLVIDSNLNITNEEKKQKPPILAIPINWIVNCSNLVFSIPIISKLPKMATAIVPQIPDAR